MGNTTQNEIKEDIKISESPLYTQEVKALLTKVSGLTNDAGNPRLKRIMHRVMTDLFRVIEDFDVQPDEFWSTVSYITALGQANEAGLLVPGLGIETSSTSAWMRGSKAGSRWTPRTIEAPLYVAGAPLSKGRNGLMMAGSRVRSCSWMARCVT